MGDAALRDRDPVQRAVSCWLPAAVEPVALALPGACVERRDAGVAGELGVGVEAFDRADLAEQLGGAQGAAAGQVKQLRCCTSDSRFEFSVKREDRAGQAAAAAGELAGDPDLHRLLGGAHLVRNNSESTARVAMSSSITAVGAVVYPDSDMINIFTTDGADDLVVKRSSAVDVAAPWVTGGGESEP